MLQHLPRRARGSPPSRRQCGRFHGQSRRSGLLRVAAPHCGHIPPPFLYNRVGSCRQGDKRQDLLSFCALVHPVALTVRDRRGIVFAGDHPAGATGGRELAEGRGRETWLRGRRSWTKLGCAAQETIEGFMPRRSISATSRRFRWTAAGGLVDRRRLSVQWFSGTILTGLCGAALMGGAVFASLDGETNFASAPEQVETALARRHHQHRRTLQRAAQDRPAAGAERAERRAADPARPDLVACARPRIGARASLCARHRQSVADRHRTLRQYPAVQSAKASRRFRRRRRPDAARPNRTPKSRSSPAISRAAERPRAPR